MKYKKLIIASIIFFLLINTQYYWEGLTGFLAFFIFLFLFLTYLYLSVILIRFIYFAIREKLKDKERNYSIVILGTILALIFFFPRGLVDFNKFEGKDILIAEGEGAASCKTTFKLKENNKFTERTVCFGVTETKGKYIQKGDTIFFNSISFPHQISDYYEFAVIEKSKYWDDEEELVRYKDRNDTVGRSIHITMNKL